MDVRTLISPSAQVVQITTLSAGDVYKRLEKPSYGDEKIVFGHVIECLNNGETAAVVALEFVPVTYGQVETKIRTFSGDIEMALFPCHPEEYKENLTRSISSQLSHVDQLRRQYQTAFEVLERMEHLAESGRITAAQAVNIIGN